jgi:hypothetical protein
MVRKGRVTGWLWTSDLGIKETAGFPFLGDAPGYSELTELIELAIE